MKNHDFAGPGLERAAFSSDAVPAAAFTLLEIKPLLPARWAG